MPDKTKFEREIDQILEKSGDDAKSETSRQRQFEPFSPTVPKRKSPVKPGSIRVNPGTIIILGVVLLAIAAFSPVAKLPLAVVGALMVAVGYVMWFRRGGRSSISRTGAGRTTQQSAGDGPQVKYWRGRRIEEKPDPREISDSGDPDDRGKIIEFGPPDDDFDASGQGRGPE